MTKIFKLYQKITSGTFDKNISFDELVSFLENLGFDKRIKGSHHLFRKEGIEEKIILQKEGNKAKAYQVRQVRQILLRYRLGVTDE